MRPARSSTRSSSSRPERAPPGASSCSIPKRRGARPRAAWSDRAAAHIIVEDGTESSARLHLRRDGHVLPADSAVNPSIFPAKGRFLPCKSRCASWALEYHRRRMARPFLAAVGLVLVAHSYAWAQNPVQIATKSELPGAVEEVRRVVRSTLYSYVGSGSFYTSGYSNPYASLALFALPTYDLGTRYKLALRARIILEQELTRRTTPPAGASTPTIRGSGWRRQPAHVRAVEDPDRRHLPHHLAGVAREPISARCGHCGGGTQREPRVRIRRGQRRSAKVDAEAQLRAPVLEGVPDQQLPRQRPRRHHRLPRARQPARVRRRPAAVPAHRPRDRLRRAGQHELLVRNSFAVDAGRAARRRSACRWRSSTTSSTRSRPMP